MFAVAFAGLVALGLIPSRGTAQIQNSVSYCDVLSPSGPPSPCSPGIGVTVTDATPVVFAGQYGGIYSSYSYDHYVGNVTSTGYDGTLFWSGNQGSVSGNMSDTVTLSGGTGTGQGVAILTFNQASNAPGPVVYLPPQTTDTNPYQGSQFTANLAIGSPFVWPGGGWGAYYQQTWTFASSPQYSNYVGGGSNTNYIFDPIAQTLRIPFSFVYGVSGPLSTRFSITSNYGAIVHLDVSVSFELPPETTMTATSGTSYKVAYAGGTGGGNDDSTTDGPLPLWSFGVLGAALIFMAARRRRTMGS
jgi:hypothetical protein